MSLLGRNSPSFVIAVALLIAIVGGYVGWRFWWPNPVKRSDRIARQFAVDARKLVAAYRRSLVTATRGSAPTDVTAVEAAIAQRTNGTQESLRALADEAEADLDAMEGISVRTLRNRVARIRNRLDEAVTMVAEESARATDELRGGTSRASPTAVPNADPAGTPRV